MARVIFGLPAARSCESEQREGFRSRKGRFLAHVRQEPIDVSDRQEEIIHLLLEGFAGTLTTEKWSKLAKIAHDAALRDIQDLDRKRNSRAGEGRR
jgi:hypothetical protein